MLNDELEELQVAVRDAEILLENSSPDTVDEFLDRYIRVKEKYNKTKRYR